ncbi:MAG: PilZ domain-containing protein [Halothiobacillus sp.]
MSNPIKPNVNNIQDNHPLILKNERRDFSRITIKGIALVKVNFFPITILNSHLNDVSASGLNITMESPLPVGTEVQLSIYILDEDVVFFVSGIILWCALSTEESLKPQFHAGIELSYRKEDTDFHDWRALFIA